MYITRNTRDLLYMHLWPLRPCTRRVRARHAKLASVANDWARPNYGFKRGSREAQ